MKGVTRERLIELMRELIESGRLQLAKKYHPDRAGSGKHEEFIAVEQLAQKLLRYVEQEEAKGKAAKR